MKNATGLFSAADRRWMRHALRLGARFVGETAPNPAVGCVIVHDDQVVGRGAHERAGTPHAEVHALREAGPRARGATAYVTLEPCNHHGRTPPCSEALIAAGIARVVVGTVDPNPRVAGAGIARLRDAGIAVEVGCLEDDARHLIADFRVWQQEQRPFVIYKAAATIDGVTAIPGVGNWQITSEASRRMVHRLRARCDLVLVGAGTWRTDDPDLRPRLARPRHRVRRGVVAHELPMARGKLAANDPQDVIWIVQRAASGPRRRWEALGATVLELDTLEPDAMLACLWRRQIYRILLEGGATLASTFLAADRIDRLRVVTAPQVHGGPGLGLFTSADHVDERPWRLTARGRCGPDVWNEWDRVRDQELVGAAV